MERTSGATGEHRPFVAAPRDPKAAQKRRVELALELQQQRRSHAFEAARSAFTRDLDMMNSLSLGGQFDDADDESDADDQPSADIPMDFNGSENATKPHLSPSAHRQRNKQQKTKRKQPSYKPWAKNLLMLAESMTLENGLPLDLETAWCAVIPARGKRVLCVSGGGGDTELMSRVSGKTLARVKTTLPKDCYIDGIFDQEQGILFALDIIRWRGVYHVDSEFSFRAFFLQSKLEELSPQPWDPPVRSYDPARPTKLKSLLIAPTPTKSVIDTSVLLEGLIDGASMESFIKLEVIPRQNLLSRVSITIEIDFDPDGLLLYLRHAHYESGPTCLAQWIPRDRDAGGSEDVMTIDAFRSLVEKLEEVNGGRDMEDILESF